MTEQRSRSTPTAVLAAANEALSGRGKFDDKNVVLYWPGAGDSETGFLEGVRATSDMLTGARDGQRAFVNGPLVRLGDNIVTLSLAAGQITRAAEVYDLPLPKQDERDVIISGAVTWAEQPAAIGPEDAARLFEVRALASAERHGNLSHNDCDPVRCEEILFEEAIRRVLIEKRRSVPDEPGDTAVVQDEDGHYWTWDVDEVKWASTTSSPALDWPDLARQHGVARILTTSWSA